MFRFLGRLAVWAVAAIVLAGGSYAIWQWRAQVSQMSAGAGRPGGPPPGMGVPVEAEPVRIAEMRQDVTAVGTLLADEATEVRPEVAGRIVAFGFAEGQAVARGTVLVQLDDSVPRAELADAEAKAELARVNATRAEELFGRGAGSARARDEALAALRTTAAAVELARARLDKYRIVAPFDGIVGLRRVSPGEFVNAGQSLVNLVNIDPIKVDFRVPEALLPNVRVGQTLALRVDSFPGRSFAGEVYAIDPAADAAGRSIALRARLPNADGTLRPGLFARVTLTLRADPRAVVVPETAVVPMGTGTIVMVVADGRAQPRPVRVGIRRGADVQITEGLREGDVVVTAGHMKLQPGVPVMVAGQRPPGAPPGAPPPGGAPRS
jgi:membrane fusion protein (multidrug efflux system)